MYNMLIEVIWYLVLPGTNTGILFRYCCKYDTGTIVYKSLICLVYDILPLYMQTSFSLIYQPSGCCFSWCGLSIGLPYLLVQFVVKSRINSWKCF